MPFVWDMARHCLEMPYGALRHFPAGTYYAQTEHWIGEAELSLMRIAHTAWYVFGHMKPGDWKVDQTKYFDWLRKDPPPIPSRRLERIIKWLWRISPYGVEILDNIRLGRPGRVLIYRR